MFCESQGGDITLALTSESLITRRISRFRELLFLRLVEMLRGSDVTFTNAECV